VFRDSLKVFASALWIGMIELSVGISKPIETASTVAIVPGTIEIPYRS